MALKRISITLPKDVLERADRRARALDRSRSWVIVEAIRAYVDRVSGQVSEPEPPAYAAREVAAVRQRHLVADLALSPAERLRGAEELTRLAHSQRRKLRGRGPRHQVIGFDSLEDFYQWKKASRAGA